MFKVTSGLKRYAVSRLGVSRSAGDDTVRKAVGKAIKSGRLSADRLEGLTKRKQRSVSESLSRSLSQSMSRSFSLSHSVARRKSRNERRTDRARISRQIEKGVQDAIKKHVQKSGLTSTPAAMIFGQSDDESRKETKVRLKSAAEMYSNSTKAAICPKETRKGLLHPNAGRPAVFADRTLDTPSELAKAISGVYYKFAIHSCLKEQTPLWARMNEHEKNLFQYALKSMPWTGFVGGATDTENGMGAVKNRLLTDREQKALLDDSTSGGVYAAPIVFDDAVVLTPILYGELFPRVNVVNVTRGRRVEGFSMSNPTITSGTAEGTAITPFTTTGFIAAFDTTIYNAVAAMEIGMDFEEDAPNDIGGIVTMKFGEAFMAWLDEQIALGDGTTEPQGVFVGSGTTAITSDNSTGGGPTVGDYEALMFGLGKQYRREPGANCAFLANEVTYRRARSIPVGPGDERRVFGMSHSDYSMLGYDYAINNNLANTQAAFVNFNRYRMYRRLGLNFRVVTDGQTLALKNTRMIILRARFGGQLELGAAAAICSDMQA